MTQMEIYLLLGGGSLFAAFLISIPICRERRNRKLFSLMCRDLFGPESAPPVSPKFGLRKKNYEGRALGQLFGEDVEIYWNAISPTDKIVLFLNKQNPCSFLIYPRGPMDQALPLLGSDKTAFSNPDLDRLALCLGDSSLKSRITNTSRFIQLTSDLCGMDGFFGLIAVSRDTGSHFSIDSLKGIIGRCLDKNAEGYAIVLSNKSGSLMNPSNVRNTMEVFTQLVSQIHP